MNSKTLVCLSVLLFTTQVLAQEEQTLSFYRDAEGEVNQHAKDQGKQMLAYAKEHGHITLWIVFAYPYNADTENMTPEEQAKQETEVAQGFSELLSPLVDNGDVWHPPSGAFIRGPGCTVRATVKGLKRLMDDKRLYHIATFNEA